MSGYLFEIDLQEFNLIVGKNAAGKSRYLNMLSVFAGMITQICPVIAGDWNFTFATDGGEEIFYSIVKAFNSPMKEKILLNKKPLLERDESGTKLYSQIRQKFDEIEPPDNKLVLHVRRDKREYPFLEYIVEWAEKTHTFKFGQVHPNSFAEADKIGGRHKSIEDISAIIEELTDTSKKNIINEFNQLGYDIENFYAKKEGGKDILYVREKKLTYDLRQDDLSQGMFRAISLITFIHYLADQNSAETIIVDDLCEGLDYERATKLGRLIFEKFRDKGVQFIVSSNDCFLMDVIPIRYWNLLVREDIHIRAYNYKNSKKKFDDFKYSGLSNFDLFSSDYLN